MSVRRGDRDVGNGAPSKALISSLKVTPLVNADQPRWSGLQVPYVPFDSTTNPQEHRGQQTLCEDLLRL